MLRHLHLACRHQSTLIYPYPQPSLINSLRRPLAPSLFFAHSTFGYSSTSASGKIVRISKIEIIGRNRMNKNSNVKKKPIEPVYIAQSHCVGRYCPHDEGKKSRCKLVT